MLTISFIFYETKGHLIVTKKNHLDVLNISSLCITNKNTPNIIQEPKSIN